MNFQLNYLYKRYRMTPYTISPCKKTDPKKKDGIKNISKKIADSQPNGMLKAAIIASSTVVVTS